MTHREIHKELLKHLLEITRDYVDNGDGDVEDSVADLLGWASIQAVLPDHPQVTKKSVLALPAKCEGLDRDMMVPIL